MVPPKGKSQSELIFAATLLVPEGPHGNSPAFQRRVTIRDEISPGGTIGKSLNLKLKRRAISGYPCRDRNRKPQIRKGLVPGILVFVEIFFCNSRN